MRVGLGFDAHPLADGRPLFLGGVQVLFERGLAGYSDGDVLLHAIIDALLGAAALGDIGSHFPSGNKDYAGISSVELLRRTVALLQQGNWQPENVDATIVAESPRLAEHLSAMRATVARTLGLELSRVSIKAKTTDGLGFTGRSEGMAAYAVALVQQTTQ